MKRTMLFAALGLAVLAFNAPASAHGEFKNLKVLDGAEEKPLEKGMKSLSKGLGVKCNACHVKGKFESDDVANKVEARKFLTAVVGEADQKKKDAALATLLKAMKLDKAKKPEKIWKGIAKFKKKKK